jgi:hypothetical protein
VKEPSERLLEKHAAIPLFGVPTVGVFCIGKIQGGQDCMFLFRDGPVNYKTHYDLPSFRPLLGGNSTTSNGLILKMNSGYNGVSRELEKGGNNIVPPYLKDSGPFIDHEAVGLL